MHHPQHLAERRLGDVIDAIASDDVSPGAGSAAAVGLALAAACAGKAVAITLKHQAHDTMLAEAQQVLSHIAHHALHGADEDASHFRAFMRARNEESAQDLLASGERLQQLGAALREVIDSLSARIDVRVCGDIAAARALCAAFNEIQADTLTENQEAARRIDDEART